MNLLEQPDDGELYVHGEQIRFKTTKHGREPADWKQVVQMRAKLSMVFQSFNLWAHMTLLENIIEAPIHVLGKPKKEAIEHAHALLGRVGLALAPTPTRHKCPAASSSAAPLPGRWP